MTDDVTDEKGDAGATVAEMLARRLKTAVKAQAVAMSAVVDVEAGLAAIAARAHLTTQCAEGRHDGCLLWCTCSDCREPCDCECHHPG